MKIVAVIVLCLVACANAKSSRIVNGQDRMTVVPHYAYIEMHRQPNYQGESYFGGGSLISQQAILTVAQNVAGFLSWRVGLGAIRRENLQWFTVATAHVHEDYNSATLAHNIAVLRLTVIVPWTGTTFPISRPQPGIDLTGQTYLAVGFGFGATNVQPDVLQEASLTVLSEQECGNAYPHLIATNQMQFHFCAQNLQTGSNICAGDQGGPLFAGGFGGLLFGVQSFNRVADCASPASQPAAFLRVSQYADFIQRHI